MGVIFTAVMLSGDNAVVIALAAGRLKRRERKRAIFFGAAGAVFLLLVFASVVTLLLQIPYFRVAGGFLLFYIAWELVQGDGEAKNPKVQGGESIWQAIRIIVVADVLMSLDNVLALIGVSGGNLWLLGVGLASTVPVVFWGSRLLIRVLERWGWLVYAGAALLGWVAIGMIFSDDSVQRFAASVRNLEDPIEAAITAAFVLFCWLWARSRRHPPQRDDDHREP